MWIMGGVITAEVVIKGVVATVVTGRAMGALTGGVVMERAMEAVTGGVVMAKATEAIGIGQMFIQALQIVIHHRFATYPGVIYRTFGLTTVMTVMSALT